MAVEAVETMPSEAVIKAVDFHPNLIFRHLDEGLVVTDKRVVVRVPRTLFGIFILGCLEKSVTWDDVDTVTSGRGVDSRRFLAAGVLALITLYLIGGGLGRAVIGFSPSPFTIVGLLLCLLFAGATILVFLSAFDRVVGVESAAGTSLLVRVGNGELQAMDSVARLLTLITTQRTEPMRAPSAGNQTAPATTADGVAGSGPTTNGVFP